MTQYLTNYEQMFDVGSHQLAFYGGLMKQDIYTTGYSKSKPSQITDLVESLNAILVDIRFSASSRNPAWSKTSLEKLLGGRYVHCPAFGNALYRSGGMQIADYAAGKALLERIDRPVILLCVCHSPDGCHRTVVGTMLQRDGFTVREVSATRSGDLAKREIWSSTL
jgi:uncharacterized protein (DUF488 family)